eukprot:m.348122 g.348122  ORF g.348122 m.348122 type:complete len:84 (-) comp35624_c0_seq1:30-281(-)
MVDPHKEENYKAWYKKRREDGLSPHEKNPQSLGSNISLIPPIRKVSTLGPRDNNKSARNTKISKQRYGRIIMPRTYTKFENST